MAGGGTKRAFDIPGIGPEFIGRIRLIIITSAEHVFSSSTFHF